MAFENIDSTNQGRDFNYYNKFDVSNTSYSDQPDTVITFQTQSVFFMNEGTGVVEYSFNGNTTHGELDSTKDSKTLIFNERVISKIWLRVKTGSTGPITIRIDAWAKR